MEREFSADTSLTAFVHLAMVQACGSEPSGAAASARRWSEL